MNRTIVMAAFMAAAFFACTPVVSKNASVEADGYYKLGVAYLNKNEAQRAFLEFQKAYEIDPGNKEVLNAIGLVYLLHFDDTRQAIDFFLKAVAVDKNYSEAFNNLGIAYDKIGEPDKALASYEKAVANLHYTTPEKAYINMGNIHYRKKAYDKAIDAFKKAIARAPNLSLPYLRIALAYNATGRYGEAAEAMAKAINSDLVYQGSREKAINDFKSRKWTATGADWKDLNDYLEIMKY